jgi:hypothetical protein
MVFNASRRTLLKHGLGLFGGLLFTTLNLNRAAAGKAAKADLLYQSQPHAGQRCATCKFFSPPDHHGNGGICAIVAGEITADGWCLAYTSVT